jgi:hypothetical protein
MVQAQCGPGDPDVELTVFRNRQMLVRNLRFGRGCLHPTATFLAVKFSEAQKSATFEKVFIPKSEKAATNIDISYAKMPLFDQSKLAIFASKQ